MTEEWKVIHSYTRAQALTEKVLVDVTDMAKNAGFKVPVALTSAVWGKCVSVPQGTESHQDCDGRLWDVLMMCRFGIRGRVLEQSEFKFGLSVVTGKRSELVTLKAHVGPDDDGSPGLTIMLPEED